MSCNLLYTVCEAHATSAGRTRESMGRPISRCRNTEQTQRQCEAHQQPLLLAVARQDLENGLREIVGGGAQVAPALLAVQRREVQVCNDSHS